MLVVHGLYYRYLSIYPQVSDTKFLLQFLKSKVLDGTSILFSGVFPRGVNFSESREVAFAQEFGAAVHEDFTEENIDELTHLVCARKNTEKFRKSYDQGMHIVNPKWFWMSIFHFKRMKESDFDVDKDISGFYSSSLINVSEAIEKSSEMLEDILNSSNRRLKRGHSDQQDGDESDNFDDLSDFETSSPLGKSRKLSDDEANESEEDQDLQDLEAELEADFEDLSEDEEDQEEKNEEL